jgi:choline dehydrogenase-like flavoprotein
VIIDAHSVPAGTNLETEVCIVGAGAAGIALAHEFIASPFRVVLLESGGMDYEMATQNLYDGQTIGQMYGGLMTARLRFFGGTTNHWGGWCLPYDAIDFEPRDDRPNYGWPFPKSHLDPWYERAQEVCGLGPYDYRPSSWGITPDKVPPPFAGPDFECKILQVPPVALARFGPAYAPVLRLAPRVTVYLHANAFNFDAGESNAEVKELSVKTLSGNNFTVRARIYILAAGGIENARLLLASGKDGGNGLGNAHDLVGRFFMVHLAYPGGVIVPSQPRQTFDFRSEGVHTIGGGKHGYWSSLGLTGESMRSRKLSNIMIYWTYRFSPVVDAVKAMKRVIDGEGPGGSLLADLSKVVGNLEGVTDYAVRKMLFGEGILIEALDVFCASEQRPNPQSRVSLGSKRDSLGMREVVVDWQVLAEDKSDAAATLRLLGAEVGSTGFGRFRPTLVDDDSPWPDGFYGNEHQMGTTRMHRDPTLGVVDENCRVHSLANLYVAGSSVFPTGGANNPTLTIVALALRLADHVKELLA